MKSSYLAAPHDLHFASKILFLTTFRILVNWIAFSLSSSFSSFFLSLLSWAVSTLRSFWSLFLSEIWVFISSRCLSTSLMWSTALIWSKRVLSKMLLICWKSSVYVVSYLDVEKIDSPLEPDVLLLFRLVEEFSDFLSVWSLDWKSESFSTLPNRLSLLFICAALG